MHVAVEGAVEVMLNILPDWFDIFTQAGGRGGGYGGRVGAQPVRMTPIEISDDSSSSEESEDSDDYFEFDRCFRCGEE